jgi:hypothetical protein
MKPGNGSITFVKLVRILAKNGGVGAAPLARDSIPTPHPATNPYLQ